MWQIGFVEKFPEHGIVFRSERREKGIPERQMMIYINCSHFTTIWKQKESFLRNSFEVWEVFIYLESLCCKSFAAKFKRKQFQLLSTQSHSQSTIFQFAIMSQRIFIHHRSFFEKKTNNEGLMSSTEAEFYAHGNSSSCCANVEVPAWNIRWIFHRTVDVHEI